MRAMAAKGIMVSAALALAGAAAAEELTIVQKVTRDKDAPVTMTSYVGTDKIRWVGTDGNEVLAEAGTGRITVIDHKKKEYSVITQQELEALATEMQARMKEMEAQMQNMPPEVRERMSGMMGGVAASVEVRKGGGGRTIAGYPCENWTMTVGAISRTEQCVSTNLALPVKAWESYQGVAARMRAAMGSMGKGFEDLQAKMKQMAGLPLASTTTVSIMGRTNTVTTEVTEIKKGPIPPSAWEIPAGYKQGKSPFAAMGKRK